MTAPVPGHEEVARALAHVSTLGRGFVIQPDSRPDGTPLGAECADREAIEVRLAAAGASLGTNEQRVAASWVQYELAGRLLAILVGTWSYHRIVVDPAGFAVGADRDMWHLAAPRPRAWRPAGIPVDDIVRLVVEQLEVLHRALRAHTSIAEGLLWGNAATSAARTLSGITETGPLARARALVSSALEVDPLRHRLNGGLDGKTTRRSCCLYYRSNDPRPCGDCPLIDSTAARIRRPV
ncbi:(2Fe-2S)-binding protein [Kibdelosporangium phytohabitans]|uniref:Uncharacterized protein n=1 Tax=Kibdelosporangium phytohabitans TaxID=860235 RepID=A0A0N9I9Y8_9PSEU|nr:(2Fe-2S)-binding protein [Kibdelosporangium phytohabitans]ALG11848.1 hypothetical protein AOZ06_37695 [Kibdelosporangium phytohabitans]MBE1463273.1 iron complex transport system ATP-binding protein [Kibdelosporangium phytohabitans]